MKIGGSIEVRISGYEPFRSKIIDIREKHIFISFPKELRIDDINKEQKCSVSYVENELPHHFETIIAGAVKGEVPALGLVRPEKEDINRIQRREFVRIQTDVDIAIYFHNSNIEPIVTVTQDISGGGLRVVLPHELPVESGQVVDLYFVLKSSEREYEYVYSKAEIIRTHVNNGVHSASLKFLMENDQDRQKIISFCFDIQREKRKQGLV